jgi:hypothetical protein
VTPGRICARGDLRPSFDAPVKVSALANPMIRGKSLCSAPLPNACR